MHCTVLNWLKPQPVADESQFVVMEVVQFMLTCMDALKLAQGEGAAVDDILPLVRDVVSALNKLPSLSMDHSAKKMPMQCAIL